MEVEGETDLSKISMSKPGFKLIITPNHRNFTELILDRRSKSLPKTYKISRKVSSFAPKDREFTRLGRSLIVSTPREKVAKNIRNSSNFKRKIKNKDFDSYKSIKKIGFDLLSSLSKRKAEKISSIKSQGDAKNEIEDLIKNNKFIKKKFEKYIEYLLKLTETDNISLQNFLFHISQNSITKHSWLSSKSLRASWDFLQEEFNLICKEILNILFRLHISEIKAINLKKQHENRMKIRKTVKKMLEKELNKEKPPIDFRGGKAKLLDVLHRMNNRAKKWKNFDYNYDFLEYREKCSLEKYKKDWRKWEQMEMRDITRKKNRIRMYNRNLVKKKEMGNNTLI